MEIQVLPFKQYWQWQFKLYSLNSRKPTPPLHKHWHEMFFVECHCLLFRMMTYLCSLNSSNMFQVLRNFTSSLETSNASFVLSWVDMTTVLLGRNISGYRNCILATFSNFGHFTLLSSRNYFTLRYLWLDVTSLKNVHGFEEVRLACALTHKAKGSSQ